MSLPKSTKKFWHAEAAPGALIRNFLFYLGHPGHSGQKKEISSLWAQMRPGQNALSRATRDSSAAPGQRGLPAGRGCLRGGGFKVWQARRPQPVPGSDSSHNRNPEGGFRCGERSANRRTTDGAAVPKELPAEVSRTAAPDGATLPGQRAKSPQTLSFHVRRRGRMWESIARG